MDRCQIALVIDAIRIQKYRYCRSIAAVTAAVLIITGWLSAYHEAAVAHAHDAAGQLVHASKLADRHEPGAAAHLHGRADHRHAPGPCSLVAAVLARTGAPSAVAVLVDAAIVLDARPASPAVPPAIATYRLAPKTSPPARA